MLGFFVWAILRLVWAVFQTFSPVSFIYLGRVLKFQPRLDLAQPDPVSIGSLIRPNTLSGRTDPSNSTHFRRHVSVRFGQHNLICWFSGRFWIPVANSLSFWVGSIILRPEWTEFWLLQWFFRPVQCIFLPVCNISASSVTFFANSNQFSPF